MKWWYWLILELLIIFGVIVWIYFFPSEEFEGDLAKGMIGFGLIYAIEKYRETNRRKTMDYKEDMTCGECLKYAFCPVANHNANHKACMKITTTENYTVEQNAGENRIEGGVVGISGSVSEKHFRPFKDCDELKVWFYINKNGISKSVAEELSKITPPSIWVRHKSNKDDQCMITHFGKIEANTIPVVEIRGMDLTMKELFENWEFLDGSDCGVKDDL